MSSLVLSFSVFFPTMWLDEHEARFLIVILDVMWNTKMWLPVGKGRREEKGKGWVGSVVEVGK